MFKTRFVYCLSGLSLSIVSVLLVSPKAEAIPLEPILNQLIEKVLGINLNQSYPLTVSAGGGDNTATYPSSSPVTQPLEQNPSYSNYPQTQQSYPQQQYPQQSYPQQYPQQPYYPQSPYPQQSYSPAPYPQQSYPQQSMPTQPFIYNPVFMVPPQVNNFNNH
jgi:hypothetical protein